MSTPHAGGSAASPSPVRVCVVTGATRGIGLETARALARAGATVVIVGRDARRADEACTAVHRESGNDRVSFAVADLASLESVRALAAELSRRFEAIDTLVNNAGVNAGRRTLTADGFESTFAVNHLAPFLLTGLLMPRLRLAAARTGDARVVTVTSVFERLGRIDFDDLHGARRYDPTRAYTQSKLANALFTHELAERARGSGVTATCVLPGLVATDLMRDHWWFTAPALRPLWRRVLRTPEEGAVPSIFAASSPEAARVTGVCFARTTLGTRGGVRAVRTSRRSYDGATRERLWEVSERLTGLRDARA